MSGTAGSKPGPSIIVSVEQEYALVLYLIYMAEHVLVLELIYMAEHALVVTHLHGQSWLSINEDHGKVLRLGRC